MNDEIILEVRHCLIQHFGGLVSLTVELTHILSFAEVMMQRETIRRITLR